jgi:hypothetical protein
MKANQLLDLVRKMLVWVWVLAHGGSAQSYFKLIEVQLGIVCGKHSILLIVAAAAIIRVAVDFSRVLHHLWLESESKMGKNTYKKQVPTLELTSKMDVVISLLK